MDRIDRVECSPRYSRTFAKLPLTMQRKAARAIQILLQYGPCYPSIGAKSLFYDDLYEARLDRRHRLLWSKTKGCIVLHDITHHDHVNRK